MADLEALLAASEEPGPYIFAGSSLGGALAWLYTQTHLDEAVGLISVDSMPPNMDDIAAPAGGHPEPAPVLVWLERLGLQPAAIRLTAPQRDPFLSVGVVDELNAAAEIARAARGMSDLGDLPLIVITHGRPGDLFDRWGDRKDEAEALFQQSQREMAAQSSEGRLVIAEESDHTIQTHVVVQAIRELAERFRESPENSSL